MNHDDLCKKVLYCRTEKEKKPEERAVVSRQGIAQVLGHAKQSE
jgi:hypothetical protein